MVVATDRPVPLTDISREHYALCERLVKDHTDLNKALLAACRRIEVEDLRRASVDRDAAASLLWETIELDIARKPHSLSVDHVFYYSIFLTALEAGLASKGPLVLMAAEHSASTLTQMMAKAIEGKGYGTVTSAANLLDALGEALEKASYQVTARGYQALAAMGVGQRLSSSRDVLNNRMRVSQLQLEMQDWVPVRGNSVPATRTS